MMYTLDYFMHMHECIMHMHEYISYVDFSLVTLQIRIDFLFVIIFHKVL